MKPARHSLLPVEALDKLAVHYGVGAQKYAEHQWRLGYEWSKSYDAMQRHLNAWWAGEDIDVETGTSNMAAAGFHMMTLLTFMDTHPEFDDRPSTRAPEVAVAEPLSYGAAQSLPKPKLVAGRDKVPATGGATPKQEVVDADYFEGGRTFVPQRERWYADGQVARTEGGPLYSSREQRSYLFHTD